MLEPRFLLFVSLLGLLVDEPKTRFDALLTLTPVMPPTRGNVFADDHSVPAANLRAARQRSLYHALHVLELFPTKFGQQRAETQSRSSLQVGIWCEQKSHRKKVLCTMDAVTEGMSNKSKKMSF